MKSTSLSLLFLGITLAGCGAEPPPVIQASAPAVEAPAAPSATTAPTVAATTTPPAPTVSAKKDGPSYVACGCGCCGGDTPVKQCLYHSKGDDLQKIVAADRAAAQSPGCAVQGCYKGKAYSFCD